MNNPPYFPLYVKDFLADGNVQVMNFEERGAYITLLCICWIEDGIPNKMLENLVDRWLANGLTKGQPGEEIWLKISHCFYEKNGKFRNKRLDLERQKQIAWAEKSKKGGLKSAENKKVKKNGSRVVQPKANSSSSSSSSNKEDLRKSSIKSENFGPLFEELWKQWPSEGRFKKKYCWMKFLALCKQGKLEEFKKTARGYSDYLRHKKENENFAQQPMHLATFLNNWEEEKERYINFKYQARL